MKIEKLPSGSYRIRKTYKGKVYSIVVNYKPTQKEALQMMAEELDKIRDKDRHMTFQDAAEKYIDSRKNVLSPSTIKGYRSNLRNISEEFRRISLSDIDQQSIQSYINELSLKYSPKYVRNLNGLISSVLGVYRPHLVLNTALPAKSNKELYIPSNEDIRKLLEVLNGSKFEIPVILACYGLRRSEICALTVEDIEGDVVHINKALVQDDQNRWVIKHTNKTDESTRDIVIPMDVADKIRKQGYVYKAYPGSITKMINEAQDKAGIPRFSLHKLRHYFASQLSDLGVSEADIMHLGGWKTDRVMKTVYRHSMIEKEEQAKREAARKLAEKIF